VTTPTSPAALTQLLRDVVTDAFCLSLDAADATVDAALRAHVGSSEGPLADLRVQVQPADGRSLRPVRPPAMPLMPGLSSMLDPASLGVGPARTQVLARVLLGVRAGGDEFQDALSDAVLTHPLIHRMVASTHLMPLPWADLLLLLTAEEPVLGSMSAEEGQALCAALLDLAGAARIKVGGGSICPFDVRFEWRVSGAPSLSRLLESDRRGPPVFAPEAPETPEAGHAWAPAMMCRGCGVDGIGMVVHDGQPKLDPGAVQRAFRLGNDHRRFIALDPDIRQAGPPCPRCGEDGSLAIIAAPAPALFAWLTTAASFTPGTRPPSHPPGLTAALSRLDLRLALRDAATENTVPLHTLLDRFVDLLRQGPATPLTQANDDALRWGALAELTCGARRGLSLSRAGILSLGLSAEALSTLPPHLQGAAVAVTAALVHHGGVWDDLLDPYFSSGANTALLPCPVGDTMPGPRLLHDATDDSTLGDAIRGHLSRMPAPTPDLAELLQRLREARLLLPTPGGYGLALSPEALVVTRRTTALSCGRRHRSIDVPEHHTAAWTGLPCPTTGCTAPLSPSPRPYGAATRWLESAERHGLGRASALSGPSWTLRTPGGQLTVQAIA